MNKRLPEKLILVILLVSMLAAGSACGVTRVSASPVLPTSSLMVPAESAETGEVSESGQLPVSAASEQRSLTSVMPVAKDVVRADLMSGALSSEVYFTASDTRAMSNYMLGSMFVHSGKMLYGSKHTENGDPYFCRMKFTAGSKGMYVRETEMIESGVDVRYLTLYGDDLFYIRNDLETGASSVVRYSVSDDSAGSLKVLYNGTCDYLFLRSGRLYFTDGDNHLISMNTDGEEMKQILADKEVFFPYLISDDILLFQDDADGETLHLRQLSTGREIRISNVRSYEYILSGTDLFYSGVEDETDEYTDMRARLYRADLSSVLSEENLSSLSDANIGTERSELFMGTRFSINGDHLNASNYRTVPLGSWDTLSDNEYEAGYTSACQYVSESFEIFYDYNSEGLVDRVLFYEPSFKRSSYIELG
ncbi:MAG: DUF5050 domain-containing protein [Eubacteriales bacterium]|nr:DUF5050 domain-containing protein [Eubacteriales bacterium]